MHRSLCWLVGLLLQVEVRRRSKIPFLFGRLKLALSRDLILRLVKWGTLGRPDEAQRSFIDVRAPSPHAQNPSRFPPARRVRLVRKEGRDVSA